MTAHWSPNLEALKLQQEISAEVRHVPRTQLPPWHLRPCCDCNASRPRPCNWLSLWTGPSVREHAARKGKHRGEKEGGGGAAHLVPFPSTLVGQHHGAADDLVHGRPRTCSSRRPPGRLAPVLIAAHLKAPLCSRHHIGHLLQTVSQCQRDSSLDVVTGLQLTQDTLMCAPQHGHYASSVSAKGSKHQDAKQGRGRGCQTLSMLVLAHLWIPQHTNAAVVGPRQEAHSGGGLQRCRGRSKQPK